MVLDRFSDNFSDGINHHNPALKGLYKYYIVLCYSV